jgi:glutaredoxin 3
MFCGRVKEFLSQKGISYSDRDVTKDEAALEELSELGYLTTPVLKIDGEVVVGFNRKRLTELLG